MNDPQCPHCSTPLSEHPANRCLDRWAAERAGWTQIDVVAIPGSCELRGESFPFLMGIPPGAAEVMAGVVAITGTSPMALLELMDVIPGCSTDIATAMELVEDGLPYIILSRHRLPDGLFPGEKRRVWWNVHRNGPRSLLTAADFDDPSNLWADGATLPHAITKAYIAYIAANQKEKDDE